MRIIVLAGALLLTGITNPSFGQEYSLGGTGQVMIFAQDGDGTVENLLVTLWDLPPAQITKFYKKTSNSSEPSCGFAGAANFTSVPAGWHDWRVNRHCANPLVWDGGSVYVPAGSCIKIEVTSTWACGLQQKVQK